MQLLGTKLVAPLQYIGWYNCNVNFLKRRQILGYASLHTEYTELLYLTCVHYI